MNVKKDDQYKFLNKKNEFTEFVFGCHANITNTQPLYITIIVNS